MGNRFIVPSLSDLRQDISGALPLELIRAWLDSGRDGAAQEVLLEPYRRHGVIVCSDGSGLSRISRERPLLEVLKLISEPKEIIHSCGTAIGGRAVGVWAADNSQMYYQDDVSPVEVLRQMISAQRAIAPLEVQVGIGIHSGEFLEIGGGLFGDTADLAEGMAENFTGGGEIAVTGEFKRLVEAHFPQSCFVKKPLRDADAWRFEYSDVELEAGKRGDHRYPYPFSEDFFEFLRTYEGEASEEKARVLSTYSRESVVVLVKVHPRHEPLILDQLVHWTLANAVLNTLAMEDGIAAVKTNGSLGIFLASSPKRAVQFAIDTRPALAAAGFECNLGIATGEVLVFPVGEGDVQMEIAGEPVNVASKISEDLDDRGAIYIHRSTADCVSLPAGAQAFHLRTSGVKLDGFRLPAVA